MILINEENKCHTLFSVYFNKYKQKSNAVVLSNASSSTTVAEPLNCIRVISSTDE